MVEAGTRRRPVVTASVLIVAGALWLLHQLGVAVRWELILPAALIAVGLAVLAGGRSQVAAALVPVGTVLAIVAVLVVLVPVVPSLSAGGRDVVVTDVADLEERYQLGVGELVVDLREVELPATTTTLDVSVVIGQVTVRVPPDATVVAEGSVGVGELDLLGTRADGIGADRRITDRGDPDAGTVELAGRVTIGQLEVTR